MGIILSDILPMHFTQNLTSFFSLLRVHSYTACAIVLLDNVPIDITTMRLVPENYFVVVT